jgi:hypothetical protein
MTIYCGVDFRARQQTICYCDSADGKTRPWHETSVCRESAVVYNSADFA